MMWEGLNPLLLALEDEGKGPWAKECEQLLNSKKGKEMNLPLEENTVLPTPSFSPG